MRRRVGELGAAVICAAVAASLWVAGTASASRTRHVAPTVQVAASGLNSPKHLTFGPGGLYIAESGTGGPAGSNCVAGVGVTGQPTTFCEGPTGSVALLTPFGVRTVLGGLPSVTEEDNQKTLGPADVTFVRPGSFGHSARHGARERRAKFAVLFQDLLVNADGTSGTPPPASTTFGKLLLANPFRSTLGPRLPISPGSPPPTHRMPRHWAGWERRPTTPTRTTSPRTEAATRSPTPRPTRCCG